MFDLSDCLRVAYVMSPCCLRKKEDILDKFKLVFASITGQNAM